MSNMLLENRQGIAHPPMEDIATSPYSNFSHSFNLLKKHLAHDPQTLKHSLNVAWGVSKLAMALAFQGEIEASDVEVVINAAIIHDIGKENMGEYIHSKDVFTPEMRQVVNTHSELGFYALMKNPYINAKSRLPDTLFNEDVGFVIMRHHISYPTAEHIRDIAEKDPYEFDADYVLEPNGVIHKLAHILAIADMYDAIKDKSRSYTKARKAAEGRPDIETDADIFNIIRKQLPDCDPSYINTYEKIIADEKAGISTYGISIGFFESFLNEPQNLSLNIYFEDEDDEDEDEGRFIRLGRFATT